MTKDEHLAHLLRLMAPPWTNGWWPHVLHRAEELAAEDEELAELPALVKAERKRIRLAVLQSQASSPPPDSEEGSGSVEDQQTA